MSTRATISVHDLKDRFDIYRHHDGYPEGEHGVIVDVKNAIDMAWEFPRFEARDFSAALVSTMKTGSGSIYLTDRAADHADRDYHYDISFEEGHLQVTVLDFTTRVDEIVGFEGTIDEAVEVFEAEPKLDEMFEMPIEAVPLIQDALELAILDINQACKWRPDEDSKRVIQKLNMAQALLR